MRAARTPSARSNSPALTSDQQAWLADVNNQRATVSSPTSFPNLVVDEYAQEQANLWAAQVNSSTYGDAGYGPYQTAYAANTGAMYVAAGALDAGVPYGSTPGYLDADNDWMAEKANCPNGNWQTCTFPSTSSGETGHYINVSNTNTVWIGLGESVQTSSDAAAAAANTTEYYDVMLIENTSTVGPASHGRTAGMVVR